jgi:hypothetical protein
LLVAQIRQVLLLSAAEVMGRQELALRLRVPQLLLDAWINGHASIPDRKFLMMLDLLDASIRNPKSDTP